MSEPTHICLDCGALGYVGGYHNHGNGTAGGTISLSELRKQWHALTREIEDIREELREFVNNAALVSFNSDEIRVRTALDHWAALLHLGQWSEPYAYPCCGTFDGCGGPCASFPCWDLTT